NVRPDHSTHQPQARRSRAHGRPASSHRARPVSEGASHLRRDAMTDTLAIAVAAGSDVGQVREHNEDHFLVGDLDTAALVCTLTTQARQRTAEPVLGEPWPAAATGGRLFVVGDGRGGVGGGEVASELAAGAIWREMKGPPATRDPEVFARLLRRATRVA